MKKTEKLGLNILEGTDPVSIDSFNENANLLDAEVSRKCGMVTGAYDGDDTANKTLVFDRKPVLVIVYSTYGLFFCFQGSEKCVYHDFTSYAQTGRPIAWEENSLILKEKEYFNRKDYSYKYIAFLES